jgi:predicted SnoaL-like aldol condensation-catalyzing enzyme
MTAMNFRTVLLAGALAMCPPIPAIAQQQGVPIQANPAPGCSATPAELEANKKVVIAFFTPGVDRVALADPAYKQHNPAFKKRAEENHVTDYEEYKASFANGARGARGPANGPRPPAPSLLEVVTAECDLVTVVHKLYRPMPGAEEGKFYEFFTFDTFRVKNGKLIEHWDGSAIPPPGAAQGAAPKQ